MTLTGLHGNWGKPGQLSHQLFPFTDTGDCSHTEIWNESLVGKKLREMNPEGFSK